MLIFSTVGLLPRGALERLSLLLDGHHHALEVCRGRLCNMTQNVILNFILLTHYSSIIRCAI